MFSQYFFFPGFLYYLTIFLLEQCSTFTFWFVCSVFELSLCTFFLVVALDTTLYIYHLLQFTGVLILPIWIKNRNLNSLYDLIIFLLFMIELSEVLSPQTLRTKSMLKKFLTAKYDLENLREGKPLCLSPPPLAFFLTILFFFSSFLVFLDSFFFFLSI